MAQDSSEPVIRWHRRPRVDQMLFERRTIYDSVEGYRVVHLRPFDKRRPETFYALRDRFTHLSCHETLDEARLACERDLRQLMRQQQQQGRSR